MLRNVATVMRGTVLGQALGFLVLPILTRLYDPAAFGHFQLYQSATIILVVFVSLRFEVALLRAKSGRELRATLALCLFSTFLTSASLSIAWLVVSSLRPDWTAQLPIPLWLLGPAVFLIGMFQFLGYLATREKSYGAIANSKIIQATGYSAAASALGVMKISLGLIVADIVGRLLGSLMLLRSLRGMGLFNIRDVTSHDMKAAAYKFREFPLITVFGGLVNSAGIVLTPVMIYAQFSPEISGQFTLVERAIALPIAMVAGAISQVYMSDLATAIREDVAQIRTQFHSLLKTLSFVAAIPALLGFLLAPMIFSLVFGDEWRLAGDLAQIMVPAYFIIFVYGGVNMTLMMLGRQVLQTAWEIFRLACMLLLWFFIIKPDMSVHTVVTLHAVVLGGVSLLFLFLAEYGVRRGPSKAALERD